MAANLIEFARQLTTVMAKGDDPDYDRIRNMMTIYGLNPSQRSLYLSVHTRAIKELGAKSTETNTFDVIHLAQRYLEGIVG